MEDVADRTEGARFDCVDQSTHAAVEGLGELNAVRRTLPSFRTVFGGTAFGGVDDLSGKKGIATGGETLFIRELRERGKQFRVKMGFRKIETDAGFLDRKAVQA
jgi:hypothetical protein